jgi:hypothetical protein
MLKGGGRYLENLKGQVTVFIIIGIVIIGVIVLVFSLNGGLSPEKIPSDLEPVYASFLSCLEDEGIQGMRLLESQGGYIDLPEFEPGSYYMPFSSQLNFAGTPIPYWYYVSGNNLQKEQVPTKEEMQEHLGRFVEERVENCNFDEFYNQSFEISKGKPSVSAVIKGNNIEINLEMDLFLSKGEDSALIQNHKVIVNSKLGNLYDEAIKVYEKEQKDLFLEKYGVDILRLYAPVDGVEFSCSPLTWNAEEIFDDLSEAIEVNTLALKSGGSKNDYFSVEGLSGDVRFINSRFWSSSFEVNPAEGPLLMAGPVGNQPGLGILGFCYVTYHFVYDVKYPVLVQVQEDSEIFQFPLAVVILGNKERQPLDSSSSFIGVPELCQYKNTPLEVSIYDNRRRAIDADISYECSSTVCYIGKTERGKLNALFPQCVNGRVIARAEGYEGLKETLSIVNPGRLDLVLDKLKEVEVRLKVDGRTSNGPAVINFVSNESSYSIIYPQQKEISLSSGNYDVLVYIYQNTSLKIGESTQKQCVDVPRGVLGIFGLTKEQCYDINIPEQIISSALSGGGKKSYYLASNELESARYVDINAEGLPKPTTLEQLQVNYVLFEDKSLDIAFR